MADDLNPVYQGDQSTWTLQMYYRGTTTARPLTGISAASCFYKLQPKDNSTPVSYGTGTLAIPNPSGGVMTLAPSAADVATPDTYLLYVLVPWDGTHLQHSDPYTVVIQSAP